MRNGLQWACYVKSGDVERIRKGAVALRVDGEDEHHGV